MQSHIRHIEHEEHLPPEMPELQGEVELNIEVRAVDNADHELGLMPREAVHGERLLR